VHWFYFETAANIQHWITQITQTLPKINDPVYPAPTTTVLQQDIHHTNVPPMSAENVLDKRQKALDHLFDDSIFNDFGFGRTFVHLNPDDTLYSSDEDIHIHSSDGVAIHDDGKVHVSQVGDTTSITLRTGNDHEDIIHGTNNGFTKVHHGGL
uniref:PH domain-containing protein n=1 Tax=Panagrolaimus sp. ES5 TaxID=591445 RepID=A0AC34G6C0_9BILA